MNDYFIPLPFLSIENNENVNFGNWELFHKYYCRKPCYWMKFIANDNESARVEMKKKLVLLKLYKDGYFNCGGIFNHQMVIIDEISHYNFYQQPLIMARICCIFKKIQENIHGNRGDQG